MAFWTLTPELLAKQLETNPVTGLSAAARKLRLAASTTNERRPHPALAILVGQFRSPILLLMIAAAGLSFFLHQPVDAAVVLLIILGSTAIGFQHEYRASQAVAKLLSIVETKVTVMQDGIEASVPTKDIVVGDIVKVSAGSIVPADGLLVTSTNLAVDEATLTGETFPVDKEPGPSEESAAIRDRKGVLFSGSHVVSGAGIFIVAATGKQTELGSIAKVLATQRPEAEFERGLRRFGMLLVNLTLLLTLAVFAINTFLGRPVLESFLFALALAVGLTPQLLPAIVSVNLSRGAVEMAKAKVIVKRLPAIENLGSMNVLCSDKTGTLTLGTVHVHGAFDADGKASPEVLRLAQINAKLQSGFQNPIDASLVASVTDQQTEYPKLLDELPYDFLRKRLSVLVQGDTQTLISKGALEPILSVCTISTDTKSVSQLASVRSQFAEFSGQGLRVLGVATKTLPTSTLQVSNADENDLTFRGFVVLEDPLRPEIARIVANLKSMGVQLKVITGDNRLVAATLGRSLNLDNPEPLTGKELQRLSDAALVHQVRTRQVFAEIEPNQKARIILALKHAGFVVGYIGDGINDASGLHAADAGISVANAVDIAKEAADFVMLEPGLEVILQAVQEGRRTFANTMKYVFMVTGANFGNMFSLAGASLLVPFLPLLPKQVLMMNFLTDIPEMFVATDAVDPEQLLAPQRWNIKFLVKFMIVFGALSSLFDFATFGILLLMRVPQALFQSAWFIESVASAALVVLVVRSRLPFFRTRPGRGLLVATICIACVVFLIPLTPLGPTLGLRVLPLPMLGIVIAIVSTYVLAAEIAKRVFYRFVHA